MTPPQRPLPSGHLPAEHFDERYRAARDPWGYEHRWYEQRKYALTLAALPRSRYRRAFEPGCSIGVLTAGLADRCDELLAADYSALAVKDARRRLSGRPAVRVERRALPEQWPEGSFDLVVLSEIAYYLDPDGFAELLARTLSSLEPGGHLVAVDLRLQPDDAPLGGEAVHASYRDEPGLELVVSHLEEPFVLEVYERRPS